MERPEYGNATYLFELVESLPVNWQVLRLIKVLNVTAFGKTSLLENRPLQVGTFSSWVIDNLQYFDYFEVSMFSRLTVI